MALHVHKNSNYMAKQWPNNSYFALLQLYTSRVQRVVLTDHYNLGQLMRLWYLSHRRKRKLRRACASEQTRQSLRCSHTWSTEVDEGSDIRHLAPLDGCACMFEEWVNGGWKVPQSHKMAHLMSSSVFKDRMLHGLREVSSWFFVWQMFENWWTTLAKISSHPSHLPLTVVGTPKMTLIQH